MLYEGQKVRIDAIEEKQESRFYRSIHGQTATIVFLYTDDSPSAYIQFSSPINVWCNALQRHVRSFYTDVKTRVLRPMCDEAEFLPGEREEWLK